MLTYTCALLSVGRKNAMVISMTSPASVCLSFMMRGVLACVKYLLNNRLYLTPSHNHAKDASICNIFERKYKYFYNVLLNNLLEKYQVVFERFYFHTFPTTLTILKVFLYLEPLHIRAL